MTTLRDLLVDFQTETIKLSSDFLETEKTEEEYKEDLENSIDEFIETVKERIVG